MAFDIWPPALPARATDGAPPPGSAWSGTIAAEPSADGVEVVLPAFSATQRWGPCPWVSRGDATPQRGDRALVVFADEGRQPWVVQWGPPTLPA